MQIHLTFCFQNLMISICFRCRIPSLYPSRLIISQCKLSSFSEVEAETLLTGKINQLSICLLKYTQLSDGRIKRVKPHRQTTFATTRGK